MRSVVHALILFVLGVVPAFAAGTAATPGPGPQELIEQVSRDLLRELDADRAAIVADRTRLRALVDKYLLPHFDTDYAARLVLGKHWRDATESQRKRFIDAFYGALMADYGDALVQFTSDRLRILPFRGDPAADGATVRTEVRRDTGQMVPVNYSMRRTPQGWKAWDLTIEGISYVRNFRTDFGAEIDQKGLEAVIARLEARNAAPPGRVAKPPAAGASAAKPPAKTD
jgi:phospholipid transport system substrate-binding protein